MSLAKTPIQILIFPLPSLTYRASLVQRGALSLVHVVWLCPCLEQSAYDISFASSRRNHQSIEPVLILKDQNENQNRLREQDIKTAITDVGRSKQKGIEPDLIIRNETK